MKFLKRFPLPILILTMSGLLLIKPIWSALVYYTHSVTSGYGSAVGFDAPYRRLANGVLETVLEFRKVIFSERRIGLPQVRLYITEAAQNKLLEDIPKSISNWQRAQLLYPDNRLKTVKVRHRGDANPINFVLTKKSWRIKTKKRKLFNNQRVTNYIFPQTEDMIEEAVITNLARRLGVLAPMVRPVELFVNDRSQGILYETQHLDESFLRSNNLMVGNLYKGDVDGDSPQGLDSDLFQSSALWKKISINNRYAEEDRTDLTNFLELVRGGGISNDAFQKLKQIAPFEIWAKFAAFQVMIQSWHNNSTHNQRIIIDDQSGTVSPILWDTGFSNSFRNGFHFNFGSQPLLSLYLRDSEFLLQKLNFLYRFAIEERAFDSVTEYLTNISDAFVISLQRDSGRFSAIPVKSMIDFILRPKEIPKKNRDLKNNFKAVEKWLIKKLTQKPMASWQKHSNKGLTIFLDGILPIDNITLKIDVGAESPENIFLDINENGRRDQEDLEIPFSVSSSEITLDAIWLANRSNGLKKPVNYGIRDMRETGIRVVPTAFALISDKPLPIRSAEARNALTKSFFQMSKGGMSASGPFGMNRPIIPENTQKTKLWSGIKSFRHITVIEDPIQIAPGTILKMTDGASLIFKSKIVIDGQIGNPVQVVAMGDKPWGTFALLGNGVSGSSLRHLRLTGGSGTFHDGITYTAMLSIHSASDIQVQGLYLADNKIEDDMMHIVYGDRIRISDINFENALSDALDIDISSISISGGTIDRAGNDCLDLMTSKVIVYNLTLSNCGDKGVSVGEASRLDIVNTVIQNSSTGIESKDRSQVNVLYSDLLNNKIQANAYQKNWRYNNGGQIKFSKSFFSGPKNDLKTDKVSRITISDSAIPNSVKPDRRVEILQDVDFSDVRTTRNKSVDVELFNRVPLGVLSKVQGRRGAAPR